MVYNVKDYGAVGNGIADDFTAIQGLLTLIGTAGGVIYFPKGTYYITRPLIVYSNQTLLFEDGGLKWNGAAGFMLSTYVDTLTGGYDCSHDISIIGCTFDGVDTSKNITLLAFAHAKNIHIKGCKFVDGFGTWHNVEVNSSENVLIEDCDFLSKYESGSECGRLQIDYAYIAGYVHRDIVQDNTPSKNVEIRRCRFKDVAGACIESHSGTYRSEYVRIHECVFENCAYGINVQGVSKIDCYDNTFIGTETCMNLKASSLTGTLHDNRIENATTLASGNVVTYSNLIDGVLEGTA